MRKSYHRTSAETPLMNFDVFRAVAYHKKELKIVCIQTQKPHLQQKFLLKNKKVDNIFNTSKLQIFQS